MRLTLCNNARMEGFYDKASCSIIPRNGILSTLLIGFL